MPGGQVLVIAHHFPPASGSGSNRALAFARYLPMFGWRPTVLTPGARWALNCDTHLLRELPPELRVVRTRSLEPTPERAAPTGAVRQSVPSTMLSPLRNQLGHLRRFPDAHMGWLPFALSVGLRERYDVAYSSSGPFTSHMVGLLLKRITGRPWVAELRDGWYHWNRSIFPDYPRWRDALERRLEAIAIRSADRVVLVTDRMAEAFREQYAELPRDHFTVVANGFDPYQCCAADGEHRERTGGWVVLHAGALYYGRSVTAFLEAARRLVESDAAFGHDFRLRLLGTLDGEARREVERSNLGYRVELFPQASHAEAIRSMRTADALLLIANTTPGAEATVPGKLFEYLAVGRPVLAIAPPESSTADVLHQTGGGWLTAADNVDAIGYAL
ncbi:MAG: glycosyltransferase family 4 protein, partial [Mycobacterium sp.]|nr:glycosyltransferase family 4 protein [Mycobacterium sp.]